MMISPQEGYGNFTKSLSLFEANAVILCIEKIRQKTRKNDLDSKTKLENLRNKLLNLRDKGWNIPVREDPRNKLKIDCLNTCEVEHK